MGTFKNHTPRQHRATAAKGGRARRKRTPAERRALAKTGGEANKRRWDRIKAERMDAANAELWKGESYSDD